MVGATETEMFAGGAIPSPQPKTSAKRRNPRKHRVYVILMGRPTLEFPASGLIETGPLEGGGLPRTFPKYYRTPSRPSDVSLIRPMRGSSLRAVP